MSSDPRFEAVMLTGIQCDVGIVAKSFGFTTKTGLLQNMVDGDPAVGWAPFPTSFGGNGGAAGLLDVIAAAQTVPYAAIEFDMGEECAVSFFSFVTESALSLPACVLYGSHNPATSTMDTLQVGDVKLGAYSTAEINNSDTKVLTAAVSGAEYRYYRFVLNKDVNTPTAPDGNRIFEYLATVVDPMQWVSSDYDSIWGKGDRFENGLITSTAVAGLGTVVSSFDGSFAFNQGGGYFGTPTVGGYAAFQIAGGVFLTGIDWRGTSDINLPGFWRISGGISAGFGVNMHASYSAFNIDLSLTGSAYREEKLFDGAGIQVPWPWYTISCVSLPASPGALGRFAENLWLKVAHSSLDGGDRKNIGGATPNKAVIVSTNFTVAVGVLPVLVDGVSSAGPSGFASTPDDAHMVRLIRSSVAGKYLRYEFPRRVSMHQMILNTGSQEVYGAGPAFDPTVYGYWQWQGSDNASSWTNVGPVWKFKSGCNFMLAPDPQPGIQGQLFLFWQMVLVSGLAMNSEPLLFEVIFNLYDPGELGTVRRVSFTDAEDTGLGAVVTLSAPGDPYKGAKFTDDTSDVLSAIITLKANPVLKIGFTDDSELSAYSDIFPSTIVQTMLHATGR